MPVLAPLMRTMVFSEGVRGPITMKEIYKGFGKEFDGNINDKKMLLNN